MTDYYIQLALAIIHSQEELIGSVAWQQAANVEGMVIEDHQVQITAPDRADVINHLVGQYKAIFGPAAVEVCKQAARSVTNSANAGPVPSMLG